MVFLKTSSMKIVRIKIASIMNITLKKRKIQTTPDHLTPVGCFLYGKEMINLKCTVNELITAFQDFAKYIKKFPQILLPLDEIERLINSNRT